MINGASSAEGRLHSTRYFIIKSLNHRNIQMSIEKGIWATQVMNEPILEEAFHNSERVVLIFSVNMSGYFQGYAQMMSPVGQILLYKMIFLSFSPQVGISFQSL